MTSVFVYLYMLHSCGRQGLGGGLVGWISQNKYNSLSLSLYMYMYVYNHISTYIYTRLQATAFHMVAIISK